MTGIGDVNIVGVGKGKVGETWEILGYRYCVG